MGDRVLIQIHDGEGRFSPVIYGHWCGDRALDAVDRLRKRMSERQGDVSYSAARMVQELVSCDEGCLSFGIWNADHLLTAGDSHGDAGVVLVNCTDNHSVQCLGGYLASRAAAPGTVLEGEYS